MEEVGTPPHQLVASFQSVLVLPSHVPVIYVVKAAVLALTELVHTGVDENAIAVILTTLLTPVLFRADVVKVPEPGLPDVKLIGAVVEATVFVPLTL